MAGIQHCGDAPDTTAYGTALQILGDAAEHLVVSETASDEAIRILLRRSREIFEEYAEQQGMRKAA
ncbi:MAG TPA: hypothetical protein VGG95_05915 [Edaphobacter sp.]